MRIALIDIKGDDAREIKTNSSVNIRNMVSISKAIDAKFYYNTAMLDNTKFDIVIFGFGSISSEINKTSDFIARSGAKKVFWLVGDYEQSMNPALYYSCKKTGLKFDTIQNFDLNAKKFGDKNNKKHFININLLVSKKPNQLTQKKYDCIYYGRWREGRADYFKKYMQEGMYLSTSTKNMKQFKHAGCKPKYLDKISWTDKKETLNLFKYSLYIEDKYTHKIFNNLANRYYEAGFCNNVVFFDVNCRNTINKSELNYYKEQVEDYIVKGYEDLQNKIKECNKDFDKHLAIQKSWRMNEATARTNMLEELKNIIYNG
jgi:hypothetical protein